MFHDEQEVEKAAEEVANALNKCLFCGKEADYDEMSCTQCAAEREASWRLLEWEHVSPRRSNRRRRYRRRRSHARTT